MSWLSKLKGIFVKKKTEKRTEKILEQAGYDPDAEVKVATKQDIRRQERRKHKRKLAGTLVWRARSGTATLEAYDVRRKEVYKAMKIPA